jgi:hypothetical protein
VARHISELLHNFVGKQDNWKTVLLQNWEKVIGSLKDKVSIEKIDRNLLVLKVCHPAWAQELFLLSDVLKQKINSLFDKEHIKEIRFISSSFKKNGNGKSRNANDFYNNVNTKFDTVCLTPAEKKSLSKVTDQELKESLEKFYIRCKRGRNSDGKISKKF